MTEVASPITQFVKDGFIGDYKTISSWSLFFQRALWFLIVEGVIFLVANVWLQRHWSRDSFIGFPVAYLLISSIGVWLDKKRERI